MLGIIDAKKSIQDATWLPSEIREYILGFSVAVHRLTTPFDPQKLIHLLSQYGFRIKQIIVAYEVPPGFTRAGQYHVASGQSLEKQKGDVDNIYTPGFYGLARDFDNSLKVILFIREDIRHILTERYHRHLKGAYDQFADIREMLSNSEKGTLHPLALVGVLPGWALSLGVEKLTERYRELVEMASKTNQNSARFVASATGRILRQYHRDETDLIILGSQGSLGSEISKGFPHARKNDIKDNNTSSIQDLLSVPSVILDCTNGKSLSYFFQSGYFIPGNKYVWIVESYPVPSHETVRDISRSGLDIEVLHIKGVGTGEDGVIEPGYGNIIPFPVYGTTMPCCTGSLDQPSGHVRIGALYDESELG